MASKVLQVIIAGDAKGAIKAFGDVENKAKDSEGLLGGLSSLGGGAIAAVAGAAAGAGAALVAVGSEFQGAYNSIRVQTGATGQALDGLKDDFKAVVSTVPTDFGSASQAVGMLNSKLGITGQPLQTLSEQLIRLSRITKTDLNANVESAANLFNNWGVATGDQTKVMDELFRASQKTGVGVSDLMTQVTGNGVALRGLGFGLEESAALMGTLGKAGLSASDVMPGFSRALKEAAVQGKDSKTFLWETWDAITKLDSGAAQAKGIDVFGAKAGPKLALAIKEGKLSLGDLEDAIKSGGDTIASAAADTGTFSGKFQLLANTLKVAVEPVATRVMGFLSDGMAFVLAKWREWGPIVGQFVTDWANKLRPQFEWLKTFVVDTVLPALGSAFSAAFDAGKAGIGWLGDHKEILEGVAIAIGVVLVAAVVSYTVSMAAAAIATLAALWPLYLVIAVIAAIAAGFIWAYNNVDWFRTGVDAVVSWITTNVPPMWEAFKNGLRVVVDFLVNTAWPVMKAIFEAIGNVVSWLWQWIMKPAFEGIKLVIEAVAWYISNVLVPIYSTAFQAVALVATWLWHTIIEPVFNGIRDVISTVFGFVVNSLIPAWVSSWNDMGAGVRLLKEIVTNGFNDIRNVVMGVIGFVTGLGSGVWDGLSNGFKNAINWIIDHWNGIHFSTPNIPGTDFGGQNITVPQIGRLHVGGTFHAPGGEGLALLRDGERVLTPTQTAPVGPSQAAQQAESLRDELRAMSARLEATLTARKDDDKQPILAQVTLDGKVLAESMYRRERVVNR